MKMLEMVVALLLALLVLVIVLFVAPQLAHAGSSISKIIGVRYT